MPIGSFQLLHQDGEIRFIFAEDIPFAIYHKVTTYHQLLKKAYETFFEELIERLQIQSLSDIQESHLKEVHGRLKRYFTPLDQLLHIESDRLTLPSRQAFYFGQPGEFSGLDQLLQWELPLDLANAQTKKDEDLPIPSTGDQLLDLELSIYMTFEHQAAHLIATKPVGQLMAMQKRSALIHERLSEDIDPDAKKQKARDRKFHRQQQPDPTPPPSSVADTQTMSPQEKEKINRELAQLGVPLMPD